MDGLKVIKVNYKDLLDIYENEISKNVKNKKKLYNFEKYKIQNITRAINKINNFDKEEYNIFLIKEPKERIVMSLNLVDKLINHYISRKILIPKLEKYLDIRNVATRKNMGTSYAIKLLKKYLNLNKKHGKFYILKLDISKYFYTIDHAKLKSMLKDKLENDEFNIVSKIIDSTDYKYINEKIKVIKENNDLKNIPYYAEGKGLPIGGLSSQILSTYYLSEIDHFIIHDLKVKYFVRYMDDFILINKDKDYLKYCLKQIENKLKEYHLKLNNKKVQIINIKNGFTFIGHHFILKNKLNIKKTNSAKYKIRKNIKLKIKLYKNKKITFQNYFCSINSYKN